MLYEIPRLTQTNRSYRKRWFTCSDMVLFIWLRESIPARFQLTYNKQDREKAITWDRHRGYHHYLVDSGETFPDHYKQSPILIGLYEQRDIAILARGFLVASEKIDVGLSDFIYACLMAHPAAPVKHSATHKDQLPLLSSMPM